MNDLRPDLELPYTQSSTDPSASVEHRFKVELSVQKPHLLRQQTGRFCLLTVARDAMRLGDLTQALAPSTLL
jgi:hypothetical protein